MRTAAVTRADDCGGSHVVNQAWFSTAMTYSYSTRKYHYTPQYVQSLSSSANVEQGEISFQKFPPAPIDNLNLDDFFFTPSTGSVVQASTTLPLQTSLSAVPILPHSYLDNSSKALPVAVAVPVLHSAIAKAALPNRTMVSFNDKGKIYRISLTEKLNWHERYFQDKENDTSNNPSGGSEPLKITGTRTRDSRVDLDNHGLLINRQAPMNCNALVKSGNSKQTTTGVTGRSKLIIRPISPSTLMALTEPCLMAWCTASDENLAEPVPSAYLPLQNSDYDNYVDKNKTVYNAWGY